MSIIPFDRTQPKDDLEFTPCPGCLCRDTCSGCPTDATTEAMDAWLAECDRVAASKGGFRACDSSIEYGEKADGEYYPMRNGEWI